ncbi:MAG: hypothetical protein HYS62_01300 [Candidatus Aenigmarchaeota archaeon]|nr:hypothetical protein [Candidatus Aenigmarchaeota archaeon]
MAIKYKEIRRIIKPLNVNSIPLKGRIDKPPVTPNIESKEVEQAGQPAPNALPIKPPMLNKLISLFLVARNLKAIMEMLIPPARATATIRLKAKLPETDKIVLIIFNETLGKSANPPTDHAWRKSGMFVRKINKKKRKAEIEIAENI